MTGNFSISPTEFPRADILKWSEFSAPLPVDRDFVVGGPQARAHAGSLYYHRGDWEPHEYVRTPWRVVRKKFRNCLQRLLCDADNPQVTMKDEDGTSRVLSIWGSGTPWSGGSINIKYKYGVGTDTPTGEDDSDYNIQSQVGQDITSSAAATYSDSTYKVTHSANRVHTESSATISEVAQFTRFQGTTSWWFLVDHTLLSPTLSLETGEAMAITYEWTF
jgi:hypothetical protein